MQVDESCYWKEELYRIAKTLKRKRRPPKWSLRAQNILERDLAVGFFITRKLYENNKLSSLSHYTDIRLQSYPLKIAAGDNRADSFSPSSPSDRPLQPLKSGTVSFRNKHRFVEKYDFAKEKMELWHFVDVADRFIHGYASVPERDSSRNWSDVYLVSDRSRNVNLWQISVSDISALFNAVACDYPTDMLTYLGPEEKSAAKERGRDYYVLSWSSVCHGQVLLEMARVVQGGSENKQDVVRNVSERFSCSEGLVRRLYEHLRWVNVAFADEAAAKEPVIEGSFPFDRRGIR